MGRSRAGRTLGSAALAPAMGFGVSATAVSPAQAASGGLWGNLGQVAQVAGFIKTAIQDFAQFTGAVPPPLTEVQQIQALILQSQQAITQEIDATQATDLEGGCDASSQDFQNLTKPGNAAQVPQYVTDANTCVSTAARLITQATANTDRHVLDEYGLTAGTAGTAPWTRPAPATRTRRHRWSSRADRRRSRR
ncbi:MAG TPA: hypothetical protein VGX23_28300 [Actinocrinis sp.]|nr:hypothetical protein [Actinocrinis sp.]